jgi:uncharacterized repeat protein (TIGR03803 family)
MDRHFNHHLALTRTLLFLVLVVAALWLPGSALAQSYALKTLYNFNGIDNELPFGLTRDIQGNLYGGALRGGSPDRSNNGFIYKFSTTGVLTALADFDGQDGDLPVISTIDAQGNLWGTTNQGGVDWHPENSHFGWGTLFEISSTGVFTPGIIEFTGPHGVIPGGDLTIDIFGNITGVAGQGGPSWNPAGGDFGSGTIFQLSPGGAMSNLFAFDASNGMAPSSGIAMDSLGNRYGTTSAGGAYSNGTLYELSPSGVLTTLVNFNDTIGTSPVGEIIMDSQGNLYGTTFTGGVTTINNAFNGYGTIWKYSPTSGLTTLASFNGTNGMFPRGALVMDPQGNLFGSTSEGGPNGLGVIFEYSTTGVLSTLVNFDGINNGSSPTSPLCLDSQGNVYGVANMGGPVGFGTIFVVQPVSTTLGVSSITMNPTTVPGGATTQGTVTISGPAPAGGMVVTLGSNSFYASPTGPVTIPAGATSATFTVITQTALDNTPVAISARLGTTTQQAILTVTPPATAAIAMITIDPIFIQGGFPTSATVLLTRVAPAGGAVVTLSNNNAAATIPASVTVPAGALSAVFPITTKPVTVDTFPTFTATLGASTMQAGIDVAAPVPYTVGNFAINFATVQGGTPLVGRILAVGPFLPTPFAINLSSNNPAVIVPASVTITPIQGGGFLNFPIQTKAVTTNTVATITASVGSSSRQVAVTILAPTPTTISSFTLGPPSVEDGHSSQGIVTLGVVAPAGGAIVKLSSPSTAIGLPPTVAVLEGETTGYFAITTKAITATTTALVTATVGSSSQQALLTITFGIPGITVSSLTLSPTSVPGGSTTTDTVFLSVPAPLGGAIVTLTSSDTTVATVPATILVPPGQTGTTFTVRTKTVTANKTVTVSANLGASAKSSLLTVTSMPLTSVASVSLNPATVAGGQTPTGTVTMSGPAPSGGTVVSLNSNNGAAATPLTVPIAPNATSATFPIFTTAVNVSTPVTITATANGTSQQAILTILPMSAVSLSSLTVNPTSVRGGSNSTGTVTLSAAAPSGGAVVTLSSSNTSFGTVPASVTVAAGNSSATFTVTTKRPNSNTSVTISAQNGAVTKTATLTVTH